MLLILNWIKLGNWNDIEDYLQFQLGALPVYMIIMLQFKLLLFLTSLLYFNTSKNMDVILTSKKF